MGADELGRWRDALLVDRDDVLIGAAKRWLGPVRTPFNKHELLERLEGFLRRPETLEAVVGLLDRSDRRILALCLYGDAGGGLPPRLVARLAADDPAFEPAALDRVRNLRERLLLYAFQQARDGERIALAPPLRDRLAEAIGPADALSTAVKAATPTGPDPFAGFCALVSACSQAKPAFKTRREPSKRTAELLGATAPGLAADRERLSFFVDALVTAGAFGRGEDGRPEPYPRRFAELCLAAGDAAPLALAAAGAAALSTGPATEALPTSLLAREAVSFAAAAAALPLGLAFSPRDLERIVALALLRSPEACRAGAASAAGDGTYGVPLCDVAARAEAVAGALSRLGYVILGDDGLVRVGAQAGSLAGAGPSAGGRGAGDDGTGGQRGEGARGGRTLVVEESHELRLLPEAGAAARAFVAAAARLEQTGLAWSAVLDRAAAKAAFAHGFGAQELGRELERLSGAPLPQSLRFSLADWEAESLSARIRFGVVVALDGHLSGALEHSPRADEIVSERLGPGVYLLAARDVPEAERLLRSAGIDVDSRPAAPDTAEGHEALVALAPVAVPKALAFEPLRAMIDGGEPPLVSSLLAALGELGLAPEEREAAEQRVRARLVLDPAELGTPEQPRDEAGRLDYPGKLRLLERALKDGAEVSVEYDDGSGTVAGAVGIPRRIGRTARGMTVTLSVRGTGQAEVAIAAITLASRL